MTVTAVDLVDGLGLPPVTVVEAGAARPVASIQLVEAGSPAELAPADLAVAVGVRAVDDVLALVDDLTADAGASGLVLRQRWAQDDAVREACRGARLTLVSVADATAWSQVIDGLRVVLDSAASGGGPASLDLVYADLFDLADRVSAMIGGPVTIEDAGSRVLAYSTGQESADDLRMSTIIGRQVPAEVRQHFRSLGVFRHLARSDEPYFVPAGGRAAKPRYVLPVRAAGEWLGSVWAVVAEPLPAVPEGRDEELDAAVEAIALCLLRIRAQGELHRQVRRDQLRGALRGETAGAAAWLDAGPWRVVVLFGPSPDLAAEARCEMWLALSRRHGWAVPLVGELDGAVYAIVQADGTAPGGWAWLDGLVRGGARGLAATALVAGPAVAVAGELAHSRALADELTLLDGAGDAGSVRSVEDSWPAMVLARAVAGLRTRPLLSPVAVLAAHDREHSGALIDTVEAVIDAWGEPQRAARALGVHPNTVRYRLARLGEVCALDLQDPAVRLAVRLEIALLRG
ncbi:PucR family transcriptional regulator [Nocardioides ginsengisoli]|uniref:PucR family transcriptional regulator n=1 Tax=Nocardioides ginsengisoli TaxID=363868 RepID=A0ABW3W143_9ACTN